MYVSKFYMVRIFLRGLSGKQDFDNVLLYSLSVVGLGVKSPSHNRNIRQMRWLFALYKVPVNICHTVCTTEIL
jgi:hypothetical protein